MKEGSPNGGTAEKLTLSFHGGTETVTGSNFLLESQESSLLIDCGLFQSEKVADELNREPFPYDPKSVGALVVTHAHLDHTGRIPKLVKEGFTGTIYSTPETKAMAELLFEDGLKLMRDEDREREPLYGESDVKKALAQWQTVPYHENVVVGGGFSISLKDAGHILGSAIVEVTYKETKIAFTGDLGNSPAPILRDTEPVTDAHYMVIESVYGDRVHESRDDRRAKLEAVIENTIRREGALLIPAFSIERTQTLLFEINNLVESGNIPQIPVFIDSPLAIKVTEIYKRSKLHFNERTKEVIASGDDIFRFPNLKMTESVEESKAIMEAPNPKVIIAGSGMSTGGRIIHHEKRFLPDPSTTILFVGYQAPGSTGRKIQEGAASVTVDGEEVAVRAHIETVHGYSAHKDVEGLVAFVDHASETLKTVFVAMGEPKSSMFLAQRLRDYLGVDAIVPKKGDKRELPLVEM